MTREYVNSVARRAIKPIISIAAGTMVLGGLFLMACFSVLAAICLLLIVIMRGSVTELLSYMEKRRLNG